MSGPSRNPIPRNHQKLHVWAASCAWSGPIERTAQLAGSGIPCCPYCYSVLLQGDEDDWWRRAAEWDANGHTNYVEFLTWKESRGRCWETLKLAAADFEKATSKKVTLELI